MFFVKRKENSLQKRKKGFCQKAFLGVLRRGTLTVELAFILPLFLMGTGTLICFMDVLRVQTEKISALCEKAMEEGTCAYLSEEKPPIIDLQETYGYRFPVSVVPLPAIRIANHSRVHSWTGMEKGPENPAEEMVYMTESGSVYHTNPQCSYVDLSISQADGSQVEAQRNQHGAKYAPCESCANGMAPAAIVYVTAHGTRYHNKVSCSRLKRTVRLVPLSETGGCPQCSRCRRSGR